MILADIGLGELLWSLLAVFFMVIYFLVLFRVVIDLFADGSLSGVAKAVWVVALLLFPMLSLLAYLIVRGGSMERRTNARAAAAEADFQSYVRQTASGATPANEIARARELLDQGVIDASEFEVLKAKALAA